MSSNQTGNLNLHQWEKTDIFSRTEFNENFSKIDTALAGVSAQKADKTALSALEQTISSLSSEVGSKSRLIFGSYRGNDSNGGGPGQTINLGFRPRALILTENFYTVLQLPSQHGNLITFNSTGFTVYYVSGEIFRANYDGRVYTYLALV